MNILSLKEAFLQLKSNRNCLVLAHNYVDMELQEIADFVGDSLQMAEYAQQSDCEQVLVCSIKIMGESVKMLNPEKKVIMSHPDADCQLANMLSPEEVKEYLEKNPDIEIVCYINTTAELRALSTITCTSANCIDIVNALPSDKEILFIPDSNIGAWVKFKTNRELTLFNSHCNAHNQVTIEEATRCRASYPDYTMLVHPECNIEVSKLADIVCSTSQMINYTKTHNKLIIGTELGLLEQLKTKYPDKEIIPLQNQMNCLDMRKLSLEDAYYSLLNEENEVILEPIIQEKCLSSLERMKTLLKHNKQ